VRTSVWTPGDLNSTPALGGNDWPTDGGIRPGGLKGVVEVREEEFRCECEWECEDRGVGLVAVFVTIVIISGCFSGRERASKRVAGHVTSLPFGIHHDCVRATESRDCVELRWLWRSKSVCLVS
jgi:hypothetical protein